MRFNLPTVLTLSRIAALPVAVFVYYLPFRYAHPMAAILVVLIGLTDFLDGYLARKWNQGTPFGAFLDPVADKLAVVVALIVIATTYNNLLITIAAMIVIGREIIISSLREWMASIGSQTSVAVQYVGKVKTMLQAVAILFLVWSNPASPEWVFLCGAFFLFLAVVLTLWSMVVYLRKAWPTLQV